jgi:hypothetical protein
MKSFQAYYIYALVCNGYFMTYLFNLTQGIKKLDGKENNICR